MIDFVKFQIEDVNIDEIQRNELLNFIANLDMKTGEIKTKEIIAEYKNMKFIIKESKYLIIQGSLHKYKNEGVHNFDKFNYSELANVLNDISLKFNINLEKAKIQNIETGINFCSTHSSNIILMNLLYHGGKKFKDISIKNGNYRLVEHDRYYTKCYDKSLQNLLPFNLLRFELKYLKMYDLKKYEIKYLSDIMDKNKLNSLKELLLKDWKKTFLFDFTIDQSQLNSNTKNKKLTQWSNPNYCYH